MTTIVHLADLHLGYSQLHRTTASGQNQREADFERAALACADRIVEIAPDLVVIAGDTLHDTRISVTGLDGAIEFVERFHKAGLRIIVIGGNHDEASSEGRMNMLHILRRHGVELYLEQTEVDVAGVRLHTMPFQVLSRWLRGRGEVRPFDFSSELPNVLLAHGHAAAPGLPSPPEEVEVPRDWVSDPRFALVCLGHVHHHAQIDERAFFAGSIERRDFGERAEQPGFWIHELDERGDLSSQSVYVEDLGVPLTPRPMHQFEIEARDLTTDQLGAKVLELVGDQSVVSEAMVRVVLNNVSAELDRSRARNQWLRAFRSAGGFYLDVVTNTRRVTELMDVQFAAPPVNIAQAFDEFLASQSFETDAARQSMLTLGSDIMSIAHEKLLAVEAD